MKNIGLIMLLCCVALLGCKSRKSHVQKSSLDSLTENRELSNLEVQATSNRQQNTSLRLDSNWTNAIRLTNFTGIIYTDGKVEGSADQAEVSQSGSKQSQQDQTLNEQDSISVVNRSESNSKTHVKKKEYDRQKEVEGNGVPWWVWLLGLAATAFLIITVYNRIKSKLNPF